MVSLTSVVLSLLISVIGVGITSYRLGVKKGAEATVQYLIDEGIVEFEADEE